MYFCLLPLACMVKPVFPLVTSCSLIIFAIPSRSSHFDDYPSTLLGFPNGLDGKESTCNAGDLRLILGSRRSPREGNENHSSILAWRIHGQRSLAGYSPWGHKESDMTEWLTHKHTSALLTLMIIVTAQLLEANHQQPLLLCGPVISTAVNKSSSMANFPTVNLACREITTALSLDADFSHRHIPDCICIPWSLQWNKIIFCWIFWHHITLSISTCLFSCIF